METGNLNELYVNDANRELAETVSKAATDAGLAVRRNASGLGNHDGYHRWVVLDPEKAGTNYTIRSKGCLDFGEARYAKRGWPSIKREREALLFVLEVIRRKEKEKVA